MSVTIFKYVFTKGPFNLNCSYNFHVSVNTLLLLIFPNHLEIQKTIRSQRAVEKQVVGQIWPTGHVCKRPTRGCISLGITGVCVITQTFTGRPSWGKLPVRSLAPAFGGLLCGQHRCHNTLWPQSRSSSGARPWLVQLVSTEPGPIEPINQCFCNESLCFYKINTL